MENEDSSCCSFMMEEDDGYDVDECLLLLQAGTAALWAPDMICVCCLARRARA